MADHKAAIKAIQQQKKEDILTAKPSRVLALALEDLQKLERTPGFRINMSEWVSMYSGRYDEFGIWQSDEKECVVCLGGSVLVERFNVKSWSGLNRGNFPKRAKQIARALNEFRTGDIWCGLMELGIKKIPGSLPCYAPVTGYHTNPSIFKRDMRGIIKQLEEAGL